MPYKCVHCSKLCEDGSEELLKGCNNCNSKFFFYIKAEKLKELEAQEEAEPLTANEKKQIEADIRDIVGAEDEEKPVFLDFESIKIVKPGKYLLDLGRLFETDGPKIYQLEDGKYVIDLATKTQKEK